MAEQSKFGQKPGANPGGLRCEEWELLLADSLDGVLPAKEAAAFAAHSAGCPGCADLLAHARQGREWLGYLHHEPEVPDGLVGKIIEKTVGASSIPVPLVAGAPQVAGAAAAVPWRRSFHEMRLLMTVAMAFFSIALTLNLAGVKLTNLRMADLRPSTISSALSRQFYGAQGAVVRFYDNLRFMYQLQARMRELRRDADVTLTPQQKQPSGKPSSRKGSEPQPGSAPGLVLRVESRTPGFGLRVQSRIQNEDAKLGGSQAEPKEVETEVRFLSETNSFNPQISKQAGPRRHAETAGYDGRSLA